MPFSTARSLVDVHVPVAVVALVKCIVKVREIACGFEAWAASGVAVAAIVARIAIVVFNGFSLPMERGAAATPPLSQDVG